MALPHEHHTTESDRLQSDRAVRRQPTGGSTGSGDWRHWRRGAVRATIKLKGMLATKGGSQSADRVTSGKFEFQSQFQSQFGVVWGAIARSCSRSREESERLSVFE